MILVAVALLIAGLASALWGVYNFWRRPLAATLSVAAAFVLFGIGVGVAKLLGVR